MGGGVRLQHTLKIVRLSSYTPIIRSYPLNFDNLENFYKCFQLSRGKKNIFSQKCPIDPRKCFKGIKSGCAIWHKKMVFFSTSLLFPNPLIQPFRYWMCIFLNALIYLRYKRRLLFQSTYVGHFKSTSSYFKLTDAGQILLYSLPSKSWLMKFYLIEIQEKMDFKDTFTQNC